MHLIREPPVVIIKSFLIVSLCVSNIPLILNVRSNLCLEPCNKMSTPHTFVCRKNAKIMFYLILFCGVDVISLSMGDIPWSHPSVTPSGAQCNTVPGNITPIQCHCISKFPIVPVTKLHSLVVTCTELCINRTSVLEILLGDTVLAFSAEDTVGGTILELL